MRLALIHHQIISDGGLERYVLGLAGQFRRRGHHIEFVTARTDAAVEDSRLPIHLINLRGMPQAIRLAAFDLAVSRLVPTLGVDCALGFGRTTAQDVHRAGGGCHAVYSRLLPWFKRWGPKNRFELALERRLYTAGATAHFVVNSTLVARQLQREYSVPSARLSVIHTAVDSKHFQPADPRPQNPRPVFLFVSSHHRRKGLDALLEALSRLPDSELWIAGAPVSARYRKRIKRLRLAERVTILGPVADLAPVYQKADFFVHPTLYDACANTVLQAMASGLVCLVSAADGACEFIEAGRNGFVLDPPNDPAVIERRMIEALDLDADARAAMSAAARERVLPLTWEAHVEQWLEVISWVREERSLLER